MKYLLMSAISWVCSADSSTVGASTGADSFQYCLCFSRMQARKWEKPGGGL